MIGWMIKDIIDNIDEDELEEMIETVGGILEKVAEHYEGLKDTCEKAKKKLEESLGGITADREKIGEVIDDLEKSLKDPLDKYEKELEEKKKQKKEEEDE